MQRNKWQGRAVLMLAAVSLAAIVGCPPEGPHTPRGPISAEEPMQAVVARVNQNARAMNFMLRAGAVSATGKIVRDSGKTESFDANGTLVFQRPRNLYMQLTHTLAGKIEIGSNDQEFWYWERFNKSRYFTGRHALLAQPWETDVPLRPDQFLDMLALHELPVAQAGSAGPTFEVGRTDYYLSFFDRDAKNLMYKSRRVAISRRPPFLVSGVTYYTPDGQPWMQAEIGDYKSIEGTSVLAPTRIYIRSLKDASYMAISFGNLKPFDKKEVIAKRIAQSPLQRGENVGEVIRLDRPRGQVRLPPSGPSGASGTIEPDPLPGTTGH